MAYWQEKISEQITLKSFRMYTVVHKKGATLVFTITLANVDRFH